MKNDLPTMRVGVIGAGPIGLAAAANLIGRGFEPIVFEAGPTIATHFESYRHVQLFSPWRYNVDPAARRMLLEKGWKPPVDDELPTAGAMIDRYLAPLMRLAPIAAALRLSHKVTSISREGFDKVKSKGRDDAPFVVRCETPSGTREFKLWAILDASGTWGTPNPLGANGLPAIGEREVASRIAYGMPDILGSQRSRYAGKRVLVAGAGHSAAGSLLALAKLADEAPGTKLIWTLRGSNFARIFGGGENDGLAARGALGKRLQALAQGGRLQVEADFRTTAIVETAAGLVVEGTGPDGSVRAIEGIDQIVVAAGGRPDLSLSSELRIRIDSWIESTEQLAPLIDPNVHSCGTVRPHGHRELAHPEARFYMVGAKSYGRAPNFLLATGHEQVRSVVAAMAGDLVAADDVQLELPETGVCSTQFDEATSGCCSNEPAEAIAVQTTGCAPSGCGAAVKAAPVAARAAVEPKISCCGGPPVKREDACCVKDEVAKDAGAVGCGCSTQKIDA